MDETSQPIELLLSVSRGGGGTLGSQIEDQLRRAIRDGALKPGARVPSTRDLARQLGVSRRIAVDAYSQLAAEGYLSLRQGARPEVSKALPSAEAAAAPAPAPQLAPRFDFRPTMPDVTSFPRAAWTRSLREAVAKITDAELGGGDFRGVEALRRTLADYLGRVRGVVAEPERVVVTCGYGQSLRVVCHALAADGAKRIAIEDPSNLEQSRIVERAGLEPVPIAVDENGIDVGALARAEVDAVAITPAHQHPTGVLLTGERRTALLAWLREHDTIAIKDDYDAEYRYDRAAVGALQALEPDRIVYAGSTSKTLAPALRIGWLVVPSRLLEAVGEEKRLADRGTARIDQIAMADFIARGELDRHLRRMRVQYRERRDAMVAALADELPEATVRGIAAGLHVTVELPDGDDEQAIRAEADRRRIALETMVADYRPEETASLPASQLRFGLEGRPLRCSATSRATLLLGYGQAPVPTIRAGVRELAAAVRAARGD